MQLWVLRPFLLPATCLNLSSVRRLSYLSVHHAKDSVWQIQVGRMVNLVPEVSSMIEPAHRIRHRIHCMILTDKVT